MKANPRGGPSPSRERRLSLAEARFYAAVFDSARSGSLAELRRSGCSEGEAEEIFTAALERVMRTVDPIARQFSEAQMVSYVKRACWSHMVAARRRRSLRREVELAGIDSLGDPNAPNPERIAEDHEAAAVEREALRMLPERDRLIFGKRHHMNLSPEEILRSTPGLSRRTYRKIIQRANTRVLDAFERIRGGERCEEMQTGLLRRYAAEECSEAERGAIEAHLVHCRPCRQTQAGMRGYLVDVASALLAAASLTQSSQSLRERVRETLLRLAARMPSHGGDAAAGSLLSASALKVASTCAGVAAGACLAAGIVPGVGGVGVLAHRGHAERTPTRAASRVIEPSLRPAPTHAPSGRDASATPAASHEQTHKSTPHVSQPSASPAQPASPSSEAVRVSGRQTGTEVGAESGGQALSQSETTAPESSNGEPISGQAEGQANLSKTHVASPEFGM